MRVAGLVLMAAAVSSLTAGCDGGPGFGTDVQLANGCADTVVIRLDDVSSPGPQGPTASENAALAAGSSRTLLVSASASSVYLWAAVPGASSWGDATAFRVADLPDVVAGEGQAAKSLVIQGDMCPTG